MHRQDLEVIEEKSGARLEHKSDDLLQEWVKEHIADLQRHNRFIEKHFKQLLVSQVKSPALPV